MARGTSLGRTARHTREQFNYQLVAGLKQIMGVG